MKKFALSILLIFIGAIPFGIVIFNFFNSSGLQWSMSWYNEAIFWGCGFSLFPISGIIVSFYNRRENKKYYYVSLMLAFIIVFPSYYGLISKGISQSSKQDSPNLELIEFWSSHWWE